MMKKIVILFLMAITITQSAFATEIPIETYPENATEESAVVVERLISSILDEVQNGLGYQMASGRANAIIRKAVIDNQTNGYGYGILSAISQNAIRYYRDVYLRPNYYAETENIVRTLISDLIIEELPNLCAKYQ